MFLTDGQPIVAKIDVVASEFAHLCRRKWTPVMDFEDLRTFVDVAMLAGYRRLPGALASRSPSSVEGCSGWKLNSASSFSRGQLAVQR